MVLDKLLDAAIEQGKKERLETASRAWLRERLEGQRNRAQQAWVKSQPRGQESEADAITRANQYREQRAHDTRVNSAKARVSECVDSFGRSNAECTTRNMLIANTPLSWLSATRRTTTPILGRGRDSSR